MTENYQDKLRKALRLKLKGAMAPTENVLYFPNNLDVRICPKNGMSSLKWALTYIMKEKYPERDLVDVSTKGWRLKEISKQEYKDDLPFRKESIRITVVRDPVKRFLSACEYMKTEWINQVEVFGSEFNGEYDDGLINRLSSLSDVDPIPDDLDDVISMVESKEIVNTHLYTQAHYLGSRGQYDKIFDMKDFIGCLEYIRKTSGSKKQIEKLHSNRTFGLYYGTVDNLTETQKKRIMDIYSEDYNYGWVEQES